MLLPVEVILPAATQRTAPCATPGICTLGLLFLIPTRQSDGLPIHITRHYSSSHSCSSHKAESTSILLILPAFFAALRRRLHSGG